MWCCLTSVLKDKISKTMQQKKNKDSSAGHGDGYGAAAVPLKPMEIHREYRDPLTAQGGGRFPGWSR